MWRPAENLQLSILMLIIILLDLALVGQTGSIVSEGGGKFNVLASIVQLTGIFHRSVCSTCIYVHMLHVVMNSIFAKLYMRFTWGDLDLCAVIRGPAYLTMCSCTTPPHHGRFAKSFSAIMRHAESIPSACNESIT
jgi:hypothetical protein